MSDEESIHEGLFRGIPIRIDLASLVGGPKFAKKEFPNRDTQTIEFLGKRPRTYRLDIVVAPLPSAFFRFFQSYFEYRDALFAVLEDGVKGDLIHPFYGRIENVVATDFATIEDFRRFGETTVSVTFEIDTDAGIPKPTKPSILQMVEENRKVTLAVVTDIIENFFL